MSDPAIDPTRRLTPQIAFRIRQMIMSGEVRGNAPLRTEHLAARFGGAREGSRWV